MPATSTITPTGVPIIDGVLSGGKWAVNAFTFSFPTSGSYYGSAYISGEPSYGFEAFTATQQATVKSVLKSFSAVANLSFTEVAETATQHADLRFAESDKPSTAWAYYPTTRAEGGDAWFNNSKSYYDAPAKGNYAYTSFIHEIGHALGLKHPHEASGSFAAMPSSYDSMNYTAMSYRSYTGASTTAGYTNETWGYAQSLMMADIAALQRMYGANFNTNSGNTTYAWSSTTGEMSINGIGQGAPGANKIFMTVWDGGGVDTYNFSNYTSNLTVDLQPGGWTTSSSAQLAKLNNAGPQVSIGNIANALLYNNDTRSLIENATGGSGSDTLTGNIANNLLSGGAGDDRLTGGSGSDTLSGGSGTDKIVFSGSRSQYSISTLSDGSIRVADLRAGAPDGTDTVLGVESFQFADKLYNVSELGTTTTTPATAPLTLYGDAWDNVLTGAAGNDKIYGKEGNDTLIGGLGADALAGDSGLDAASYATAKAGVVADLTYGSNNTGDAKGDTFSGIENLLGSAYTDTLSGNSAANVLEGGAGADKLIGGSGTDTASYAGAKSAVTADLTAVGGGGDAYNDTFSSMENLTGSAYGDFLKGNTAANVLMGGGGADTLYGREGNDTLTGGAGNDTLVGDAGTDIAVYSGASSNYRTTQNADGSWTITDLRAGSPEGTDKLVGIETIRFLAGSASASAAAIPHEGAEHMHPPDNMPLPQAHSDRFHYGDLMQTKLSALSAKSGLAADDLVDFLKSSAWASVSHTESGPHDHDLHFRHASQHHFDDWMH